MATGETKTVLAGVDGSAQSIDAMALAMVLAPHLGARARAAYVHPLGESERAVSDPLYRNALDELASFVRVHMREPGAPLDARTLSVIEERFPARGLADEARRRGSPLVAVGASHRSQLGRALFGGTAERLMTGSPCPVAVAPKGYANHVTRLGTIGCAFDGSAEARAALVWAKALAGAARCDLRILTVHKPQPAAVPAYHGLPMVATDEAAQRELRRRLVVAIREVEADGVSVEGLMLEGRPASLLQEHSAELDLLVAGSRGYGPSRAVLVGSVSRALVRNPSCPVVIMPRNGDEEGI
jgi:nucleotide-binding universal stress UspA family protein